MYWICLAENNVGSDTVVPSIFSSRDTVRSAQASKMEGKIRVFHDKLSIIWKHDRNNNTVEIDAVPSLFSKMN